MKKRREPDGLSREEMGTWCRMEVRNVLKECELRVNEAMELTTAYQEGQISRKEANARRSRYDERWDDAIWGMDAEQETNEQILEAIDAELQLPPLPTGSMVSKVKRSRSTGRSK